MGFHIMLMNTQIDKHNVTINNFISDHYQSQENFAQTKYLLYNYNHIFLLFSAFPQKVSNNLQNIISYGFPNHLFLSPFTDSALFFTFIFLKSPMFVDYSLHRNDTILFSYQKANSMIQGKTRCYKNILNFSFCYHFSPSMLL